MGGQRHDLVALPPGKIRYTLYVRLGELHGRSRRVRKISPTTQFDPRTVQSVANRYTDYAIPPHIQSVPGGKVSILGGHIISHSKQKSVHVHVSYSEWLQRYNYVQWFGFGAQ